MNLRIKNLIIGLLFLGLILPSFSFAQTPPITPPENLDEVKKIGENFLKSALDELPTIIKKVWKEEVLPIWQKMYDWFKANVWPKIDEWFKRIIKPEVEKRKPIIEEEFKKEKQETKEELPKVIQYLWEKIKGLMR